ncbi:hypothetical protein K488DRAFT_90162 [Vararia minispora EC-137]|uniref:Uncharacterized protein n=1 Tax=Vararia minispora EC-137 TaxID=1314806 RepID=A0ACB8Q8A3_9AGAM|nr:hypothetical protein K488DRAFT_90162 [Vararia minispora EC-137]
MARRKGTRRRAAATSEVPAHAVLAVDPSVGGETALNARPNCKAFRTNYNFGSFLEEAVLAGNAFYDELDRRTPGNDIPRSPTSFTPPLVCALGPCTPLPQTIAGVSPIGFGINVDKLIQRLVNVASGLEECTPSCLLPSAHETWKPFNVDSPDLCRLHTHSPPSSGYSSPEIPLFLAALAPNRSKKRKAHRSAHRLSKKKQKRCAAANGAGGAATASDSKAPRSAVASASLDERASYTFVGVKRGPRGRARPREGIVLSSSEAVSGEGLGLEAKKQSGSRRRRRARDARERIRRGPWGKKHSPYFEKPRPFLIIAIDADAEVKYSVERRGYTGSRRYSSCPAYDDGRPLSPAQLDKLGFYRYEWDASLTHLVLDDEERIIMVLVGNPSENDKCPPEQRWHALFQRLAKKVEAERYDHAVSFDVNHRRGAYSVLSFGLSYGGGQTKPQLLRLSKAHNGIAERLKDDQDLQRVAGFQSEILASYFPLAYQHLRSAMRKLQAQDPCFTAPFPNSVYPAGAMNFGPETCCNAHFDVGNYPSLPCAITAFGDFDPNRGGHLVLHDLKIYFRFPPGATVLLSSAGIRHGNATIRSGETRLSFTQFCPGGLMRWVAYGCRPAKPFSVHQRAQMDAEAKEGWKEQLRRFSKVWDLDEDRAWVREQERLEDF